MSDEEKGASTDLERTMSESDHERARGGRGRFVKSDLSVARDAEAFRMRSRGYTYQQISDALDYGSEGNVRRAIREATESMISPAVHELREVMDAQLVELWQKAQQVLHSRHLVFWQGQAVTHEGVPVTDDIPVLKAAETLVKIQERRARLWGADAPAKQAIEVSTVQYSIDGVDMEAL
jgi:hypothetical protein